MLAATAHLQSWVYNMQHMQDNLTCIIDDLHMQITGHLARPLLL
jgi:hypothetical protein